MLLTATARESFVPELDEFLEAFGDEPNPEAAATYLIELLETWADEHSGEDIVADLEDSGSLDGSLRDVLEQEMESNAEFEFTGEEIVSLLERLCDIEWGDDDDDNADNDDDDDDDDL